VDSLTLKSGKIIVPQCLPTHLFTCIIISFPKVSKNIQLAERTICPKTKGWHVPLSPYIGSTFSLTFIIGSSPGFCENTWEETQKKVEILQFILQWGAPHQFWINRFWSCRTTTSDKIALRYPRSSEPVPETQDSMFWKRHLKKYTTQSETSKMVLASPLRLAISSPYKWV